MNARKHCRDFFVSLTPTMERRLAEALRGDPENENENRRRSLEIWRAIQRVIDQEELSAQK